MIDRTLISSHVAHILQLTYFMLPAYLANMTPPIARFWKGWNRPISRRCLGDHKTVVGFISGMVVALAVAKAFENDDEYVQADYRQYNHGTDLMYQPERLAV